MANEGSEGVEGILKSVKRPSCSKTKSVNVPPVSTPMRMRCLLANRYPAPTFIRSTQCVQHELYSIAVLKSRGIFDGCFAGAQGFDNRDRERGETPGPTTLAHTLGHVVLFHLHRTPRARAGRRKPELAGLFNPQRALRAITLEPVLVLSRLDHGDRSAAGRVLRVWAIGEQE